MLDYLKRFLIAGIVALCVSLLFFGSKPQAKAMEEEWTWPTYGVISDTYGTRLGQHKGIDIAGELNSPIIAVYDGIVSKSYYSDTYGHVVFIKHNNGLETVYAHLNKRNVQEGQQVKKGSIIGLMGNTGSSSGVHLHFEVHENEWTFEKENAINPAVVLGNTIIGDSIQASRNDNAVYVVKHLNEKASQFDTEKEHIVAPGETLWSIAQMYGFDVDQIIHYNTLSDSNIHENQRLMIPPMGIYIVKNGDTLSDISQENNLSVEEIKKINQLHTDLIYPSQVIRLPDK